MPVTTCRRRLMSAMSEEFAEVRSMLEGLAEALVCDEAMIERHVDKLQQFDLIIQHVDESSKLLARLASGTGIEEAIGKVCLGRLQGRLNDAFRGA